MHVGDEAPRLRAALRVVRAVEHADRLVRERAAARPPRPRAPCRGSGTRARSRRARRGARRRARRLRRAPRRSSPRRPPSSPISRRAIARSRSSSTRRSLPGGSRLEARCQEAGRAGHVAETERPASGADEVVGGAERERVERRARGPELGEVACACSRWWPTSSSRSAAPRPPPLGEPARGALVQLRASLLRDRRVGSLPDEHVAEPEAVLALERRRIGLHELLADERLQQRPRARRRARPGRAPSRRPTRRPPRSTAARWSTARSSSASRSRRAASTAWIVSGTRAENVPGRDEVRPRSSSSMRTSSWTKSGLPAAARATSRARPAPSASRPPSRSTSRSVASGASGRRTSASDSPGGPGRAALEQVGPREAEDEDRRRPAPAGEVLDEVEQRRLGPVDVVEDDEQRTLLRRRLEQPAEGPRDLVRACLAIRPAPIAAASRSATSAAQSSSGSSAAIRPRAAAGWSGRRPARSRRISATGQ